MATTSSSPTAAGLVLINYNSSLVTDKDAPKKWTDLSIPVEGQGLDRPSELQRLRRDVGRPDEEDVWLGLLQEARAEQAAHRPLDQTTR